MSTGSAVASGGYFNPAAGSPFAVNGEGGAISGFPDSVVFSPDGLLLATADALHGVSVFSVAPGGVLTQVPGSPYDSGTPSGTSALSVAFSPDGGLLATANTNNTVSVFSVASGGALTPAAGSPFATGVGPQSVAFSPDGALLATANYSDKTVSVFSVGSGGVLTPVGGSPFTTGVNSYPFAVAFSPAGGLLATANNGNSTVGMFSVGPGGALTQVSGSPFATGRYPEYVAFSPDGGVLATASTVDATVSTFTVGSDGRLAETQHSPYANGANGYGVAFSAHRWLFGTANDDGTVSVFSAAGDNGSLGSVSGSPFKLAVRGRSVAFSPDGTLFAADNSDNSTSTVSVFTVAAPYSSIRWSDTPPFAVGQRVTTTFSCTDPFPAPGIASCLDSNGSTSPGTLDTSTPGPHTYTVTATSQDRQSTPQTIPYLVADPPTASISSPAPGGTYTVGQQVPTRFSCQDGVGGPGVASCVDSTGNASGVGQLETAVAGTSTYLVTVVSQDGLQRFTFINYTVKPKAATKPKVPRLNALTLSPHSFKPAKHGTTISYRDTQAATTTLRVLRCTGKHNACTRLHMVERFSNRDRRGTNRLRFTGRLHGHALHAGRYVLRATATLNGQHSRTISVTFAVV